MMNRYELDGEVFLARDCRDRILIDPELPANFFFTPNEERPAEQRRWWGRAFVMTHDHADHEVLILDGGCHDRPTFKTREFLTLDQALEIAQDLSGGTWGDWPGHHFPDPATCLVTPTHSEELNFGEALKLLAAADAELRLQAAVADPMAKLSIYWELEDLSPLECELAQLEALATRASDPFTRGYLHGIYLARLATRAEVELTPKPGEGL